MSFALITMFSMGRPAVALAVSHVVQSVRELLDIDH